MRLWLLVAAAALAACSGREANLDAQRADAGTRDAAGDADASIENPTHMLVTADFLNRSLTLFDADKLVVPGVRVEDARVGSIDLSLYAPGPVELAISPDGQTAVVAVGPAFFDALGPLLQLGPIAPGGTLLIVDLVKRAVRAEVITEHVPMGIAISPDGSRAYTANFGEKAAPGSTLSVVDLALGAVVEELDLGSGPEQICLSDDASRALVNVVGGRGVRGFDPSDAAASLSGVLELSDDPSDCAFVGNRALVANSRGSTGYSVVDVSDASAPTLIESVDLTGGFPYGATRVPGTDTVLVSISLATPAELVSVDLSSSPSVPGRRYTLDNDRLSFPMKAAIDSLGRFAFVPLLGQNSLAIVDLASGGVHSLSWLDQAGPSYAALSQRP